MKKKVWPVREMDLGVAEPWRERTPDRGQRQREHTGLWIGGSGGSKSNLKSQQNRFDLIL